VRITVLVLVVGLFLGFGIGAYRHANTGNSSVAARNLATLSLVSTAKKPDFQTEIKPIFQARCQPCHFQGGQVYDKMPFDKPETINRLGEKLFTRIKDKEEQRLIREFLSQP
jgi:hypothetical protein